MTASSLQFCTNSPATDYCGVPKLQNTRRVEGGEARHRAPVFAARARRKTARVAILPDAVLSCISFTGPGVKVDETELDIRANISAAVRKVLEAISCQKRHDPFYTTTAAWNRKPSPGFVPLDIIICPYFRTVRLSLMNPQQYAQKNNH